MKVNKYCKVNFENPTPSKKYVDVVINIEAIDKTDGFLNFVFLMDNEQKCYEVADYYTELEETDKIYIKEIDVDINLPKDIYKKIIADKMEYGPCTVDYIAMKIKTRNKDFYAVATNYHNGYYYHDIFYTKDTYKVTTSEDDLQLVSI